MDFLLLDAVLAGIFTALESTMNSRLGERLTPAVATTYSLISGTLLMLTCCCLRGSFQHNCHKIFTLNPIWLAGGFFGAAIIYLSSRAIPALGVSRTLTVILAAQLITAMLIDAAFAGIPIDRYKIFGMALLLLGANLMGK